jgi:hypothetical protein
VTAFGAAAVSLTAAAYALDRRWLFAAGCGLSSAYGFLIGSVPFGAIEALWAMIVVWKSCCSSGTRTTAATSRGGGRAIRTRFSSRR